MKFENPYPHQDYDSTRVGRINSDISREDYSFIQAIDPMKGVIQTTVNLLWRKLVESLKQNGITTVTQQFEYRDFVANLRFVDGRNGSTPCGAMPQAETPNVRGGTSPVVGDDKGTPPVVGVVEGTSKRRRTAAK